MTWEAVAAAAGGCLIVLAAGNRIINWAIARAFPHALTWPEWVLRHGPLPCGCTAARRVDTRECTLIPCPDHRPADSPLPPDLARYDQELHT